MTAARRPAASALFQSVIDIRPQSRKSGRQSTASVLSTTPSSRANPTTFQSSPISLMRGKLSGRKLLADRQRKGGQPEAEQASGRTEHQAFDKRLAAKVPRRRSKRQPNRDLALPANGPHQQQPRQVCACDQQHHRLQPETTFPPAGAPARWFLPAADERQG